MQQKRFNWANLIHILWRKCGTIKFEFKPTLVSLCQTYSTCLAGISQTSIGSRPKQPNCKVNVLPRVRFFYRTANGGIAECLVNMQMKPDETTNQGCIDAVVRHYKDDIKNTGTKKAYFIWLVHGWRNSGKTQWISKMKNSYFHKYPSDGLVFK